MDSDPHPLEFPGSQVVIDALPLGKIDWQHAPLDPAFGHIKDGMEHCSHTQCAGASTAFGGWDQIFDPLPFLVGQITWICCFVHLGFYHLSSFQCSALGCWVYYENTLPRPPRS